jgi:hypothetical protein
VSYLSRLAGRLVVDPPQPETGTPLPALTNLRLTVTEEPIGASVFMRRITAVEPASGDGFSMYDLREELARVAEWATDRGARLSGQLVRSGEEQGDVERFTVTGQGAVISETAQLRWPDGTAVTL